MNKAEGGNHTVCPGSSGPFYIVTYYIKWVTTSLTYSKRERKAEKELHLSLPVRSMFVRIKKRIFRYWRLIVLQNIYP